MRLQLAMRCHWGEPLVSVSMAVRQQSIARETGQDRFFIVLCGEISEQGWKYFECISLFGVYLLCNAENDKYLNNKSPSC